MVAMMHRGLYQSKPRCRQGGIYLPVADRLEEMRSRRPRYSVRVLAVDSDRGCGAAEELVARSVIDPD
jgi:hypothetical protein